MHSKPKLVGRLCVVWGAFFWVSLASADPYELNSSDNATACPESWLALASWDVTASTSKNADACWTKSGNGQAANPSNPNVAGGGNGFSVDAEIFSFLDKIDLPDMDAGLPGATLDGNAQKIELSDFELTPRADGKDVMTGNWAFSGAASQAIGSKSFLLVFKQGGGTAVDSGGTTMTAFMFAGVANAIAPYSGDFSMAWATNSNSLSNFTAWISEIPSVTETVPVPATLVLLLLGLVLCRHNRLRS